MKKSLALAVLATAFGATSVSAAGFTVSLGASSVELASFDGFTDSAMQDTGPLSAGIESPVITADVLPSGSLVSFTFLGKEAGHKNSFQYKDGDTLENDDPVGTEFTALVEPGPLQFTFFDLTDGDAVSSLLPPAAYASYAVLGSFSGSTFVPATGGGKYDLILGFNDGARVDADYDDMVVGLRFISAIPEPGTYALILAGLGVVGFMARRQRGERV